MNTEAVITQNKQGKGEVTNFEYLVKAASNSP